MAAAWDFEGRELHAYSIGGRLIWTHDFGRVASRPASFARKVGPQADVNNDGRDEVLIPMRFAPPSATATESDAVVAFGPEGEVVWSVQPQLTLRWGDETFNGPWNVQDIVTGMTVRGPRTWIAFSHQTWWPGFVMEVEPNGDARLQYGTTRTDSTPSPTGPERRATCC